MNISRAILAALTLVTFLLLQDVANAQFTNFRYANLATRDYILNRPTVSPYVSLGTRNNLQQGLPTYYTNVRPQVERRAQEQAQRQMVRQNQRQINSIRNEYRQAQQNEARAFTTGRVGWSMRGFPRHGSTLNFYPGFAVLRR